MAFQTFGLGARDLYFVACGVAVYLRYLDSRHCKERAVAQLG